MNSQFQNILQNEPTLLVVINNSVCDTSSAEQIKFATLEAWRMDFKKAVLIDYVVGVRNGVATSCYKIDRVGIRKKDHRVVFGSSEDLSEITEGYNLKEAGIRKGYKELQYLNLDKAKKPVKEA